MLRERSRPIAVLACATVALLAGCGDSGEQASTSSTAASTSTTAEVTPLRRRLEAELQRLIEAGDAKVDSECVIEALRTTLSNDEVQAAAAAARGGEDIPQDAADAAYAAGRKCTRR